MGFWFISLLLICCFDVDVFDALATPDEPADDASAIFGTSKTKS
jgi:hypothetical protein